MEIESHYFDLSSSSNQTDIEMIEMRMNRNESADPGRRKGERARE
jgi:hypothetical protein